MADNSTSGGAATPKTPASSYKVSDIRENDVVLKLDDGRVFVASVKEGLEGLKRSSTVAIRSDGVDEDGVPKNAVVERVL